MNGPSPEVLAMSKRIVDMVNEEDFVTFAGMANRIDGFRDTGPNGVSISVGTKGGGRLVFWAGMSEIAVAGFEHATQSGQITATTTEALCYTVDGGMLNLPIASIKNKKAFDKPGAVHWLPMTFRPVSRWPISKSFAWFHDRPVDNLKAAP